MKKSLFAAVALSTLIGAAAASAQGLPPNLAPPQYGFHVWSENGWLSRNQSIRVPDAAEPRNIPETLSRTAERKAGAPSPSSRKE